MLPERVPQYLDGPSEAEWLQSKASTGSHKAVDCLRCLLEFVAVAALGGDPFTDLSVQALQDQLREAYRRDCESEADRGDPIDMAITWAWPPVVGGWVTYESDELILAADALCRLASAQPHRALLSRLSASYVADEASAAERVELGLNLRAIGVPRAAVEGAIEAGEGATSCLLDALSAYDQSER